MSQTNESQSHSSLARGNRSVWYDRYGNPVTPEKPRERTFTGVSPHSRRRRRTEISQKPTETEAPNELRETPEAETVPETATPSVPDEEEVVAEPIAQCSPEDVSEPAPEVLPEEVRKEKDPEVKATPRLKKKRSGLASFAKLYLMPLCVLAAGGVMLFGRERVPDLPVYDMDAMESHRPYTYIGSFNRDFADLNDLQLEAAKRIGIRPAATRAELRTRDGLVPVSESTSLTIDRLTHSEALLVPQAAVLLNEIGAKFTSVLSDAHLPLYSIIVTSITRADEDVQKLRRGNGNASDNSTHAYGTTFDISWRRFQKVDPNDPRNLSEEELKHLLAIVLADFHDAGRCYIKHERYQACFHITTIK